MTLSVCLCEEEEEEEGAPRVHNLLIKQHKSCMSGTSGVDTTGTGGTNSSTVLHVSDVHLDGSSLLFDDVFKLVSFYCISRYLYEYCSCI